MLSFNLTLLLFELKRQLSVIKQNKEMYMEIHYQGFTGDVKKELLRMEQAIESLSTQIQLLEE